MSSELRNSLQSNLGSSYTIERELGGGGMSRVFVAEEARLGRRVVVKVLPPELVAGVSADRFQREIRLSASLQHANIVPVLTTGDVDGLPYYTMPFVEGESLRARLARGPLLMAETVTILKDVARALAYAHSRGVVHRDIKPDNVLLSGGAAVVADFGIAKAISAARAEAPGATHGALTLVGTSIGTPAYMAPEQAAADPAIDARADLYSFGCMAYEMLAGQPPFVAATPQKLLAAHMGERPTPITNLRPDTPALLADVVMRCLEKEAADRPQSSADVVQLLESVTTSSGDQARLSAALLGQRVSLSRALAVWAAATFAIWIVARAAMLAFGLPDWVVAGSMLVMLLGLPVILLTHFVQRTAHRLVTATPTVTAGGSPARQGTMATMAMRASPHLTWKRTTRGGIAAVAAFALVIAAFMGMRHFGIGPVGSLLAAGKLDARQPILITDFTVTNADSALGDIVTEALRAALSDSRVITLMNPQSVAAALARMQRPPGIRVDRAIAQEMAQREGLGAIIDGTITGLAGGYAVSIRLLTADSAADLASFQRVVDSPRELISAVDEIGREMRGRIGESLRRVRAAPPLERVTTSSIEALRLYSEGVRAGDMQADIPRAIARLTEAVTIDSSFAMAWRKLSAVYSSAGFQRAAVDSAIGRAYLLRDRLPERERLQTEAFYFGSGPGRDRQKGIQAYEELLRRGDTAWAANNLGLYLMQRREFARAESLFVMSASDRDSRIPQVNLVVIRAALGKVAEAESTSLAAHRHFSATGNADEFLVFPAYARWARGDFNGAERLLDSMAATPSVYARFYVMVGRSAAAFARGRIADGSARMREQRRSESTYGVRIEPALDSAYLSMIDAAVLDRRDRAVARLDATVATTRFTDIHPVDRPDLEIAEAYAMAGRPDRARAMIDRFRQEVRDTALLRFRRPEMDKVLAEIAMAERRPLDALRLFARADSLPDGPATQCEPCALIGLARAYDAAGDTAAAVATYERFNHSSNPYRLPGVDIFYRGPATRRLAELYEAAGDRAKAMEYYSQFVTLWERADAELQPQVADVRRRIERLAAAERATR